MQRSTELVTKQQTQEVLGSEALTSLIAGMLQVGVSCCSCCLQVPHHALNCQQMQLETTAPAIVVQHCDKCTVLVIGDVHDLELGKCALGQRPDQPWWEPTIPLGRGKRQARRYDFNACAFTLRGFVYVLYRLCVLWSWICL